MAGGEPPGRLGVLGGELTGFVGRRRELADVREALASARLVTLTGPGGIGKTRLAVRAVAEMRRGFRDGARLAELAALRDPALLAAEVARSLGLLDRSSRWGIAALAEGLASRQMLVVLDNCEHLRDACAVLVGALLRACPELLILATSREVLRPTPGHHAAWPQASPSWGQRGCPVVSVGVTTPQHRADMFLDPASDPREGGARLGDERSTLNEYLRGQRLTLQVKCDGLDAGQLARRAVEPSTMSLLGLVRHMAEVERTWFRRRFAGSDVPKRYQTQADPDADFNGAVADPAVVEEAWAAWREEIAFADEFTRDHDLGFLGCDSEGEPVSLRELLVHMIEEYARHNGHADLLRERIDGCVGQ